MFLNIIQIICILNKKKNNIKINEKSIYFIVFTTLTCEIDFNYYGKL